MQTLTHICFESVSSPNLRNANLSAQNCLERQVFKLIFGFISPEPEEYDALCGIPTLKLALAKFGAFNELDHKVASYFKLSDQVGSTELVGRCPKRLLLLSFIAFPLVRFEEREALKNLDSRSRIRF